MASALKFLETSTRADHATPIGLWRRHSAHHHRPRHASIEKNKESLSFIAARSSLRGDGGAGEDHLRRYRDRMVSASAMEAALINVPRSSPDAANTPPFLALRYSRF
jgi:hypothetical protein